MENTLIFDSNNLFTFFFLPFSPSIFQSIWPDNCTAKRIVIIFSCVCLVFQCSNTIISLNQHLSKKDDECVSHFPNSLCVCYNARITEIGVSTSNQMFLYHLLFLLHSFFVVFRSNVTTVLWPTKYISICTPYLHAINEIIFCFHLSHESRERRP